MRRLTTLAMMFVVLGGVVGCGSSKPASPLSTAATTPVAQSPLTRCVQAWNNGVAVASTPGSGRDEVGTQAYSSHVATVAIYAGSETAYVGSESIRPGACMVIAGYSIWIQEPNGLWASARIGEASISPEGEGPFRSIGREVETWSVEHANVWVAPTLGPGEPGSENDGKLTAMDGKSPFQMTPKEVGGEDYAEHQKAEAENRTESTPTSSAPKPSAAPTSSQSTGKPCPSNGLQIRGEELPSGQGTIEDTTSIGTPCSVAIEVVKTWIGLKPKGEAGTVSGFACAEAKGENNHSFTVACSNGVKRVAFRVEEPH